VTVVGSSVPGDCCQAFAESYEFSTLPEMRDIERSVLGCDYGGTSWTTARQAQAMAAAIELATDGTLLEIGAGAGWPGLYFAKLTGRQVVLLDLPLNALHKAGRRASADGSSSQIGLVAASGAALPFADDTFPAISHSDVLCCLPEKTQVLRECRRVARAGATMVFAVIYVSQGLDAVDRQRSLAAGPPFLDAAASYEDMLTETGWQVTNKIDVTDEYRDALLALVDGMRTSKGLRARLDESAVEESIAQREEQIRVIEQGFMSRAVYHCR
jgi:SAM-dependent methyltransferase